MQEELTRPNTLPKAVMFAQDRNRAGPGYKQTWSNTENVEGTLKTCYTRSKNGYIGKNCPMPGKYNATIVTRRAIILHGLPARGTQEKESKQLRGDRTQDPKRQQVPYGKKSHYLGIYTQI